MIDERKIFDKILKDWGTNILLQRRGRNGEYTNTFERHTIRSSTAGNMGLFRGLSWPEEGEQIDTGLVLYFRYDVRPREADRVYEEEPRHDDIEMGEQSVYIITDVYRVRGRLGRTAFFTTRVQRHRPT